ncbi:GH1 family beta-glucosidase [Nocardioides sp.]|uniref:GH1 family beta-glucosidase n=1 Tax=Nocardioides sp. TaxID=35761 RepID=UPI00271F844B|nr:GH1 family beta-glucosidase [Nocardioides sp.]MDO9457934.1 GH1 family beta-glucosidase [Nocardioides sp.]
MPPPPPADGVPQLPPGFVLGAATAAYQVEGAVAEDGRGPSIWDTFSHQAGRITDGSTGDVAADHYHRSEEDVALLGRLGVGSYRFSVSWSRVVPSGRGPVNAAGLDFYDRLVDCLLEQGIDPMVTLYHHDLPQALEDDGGWLNPATAHAFGDYAAVVGERLADRVPAWVPLSEPNVAAMLGYGLGTQAPGHRLLFDALHVCHQVLMAHGHGVAALRSAGAREVGCANNHAPIWPGSEDPADVGAGKLFDSLWNGMFLEPMLLGHYPVDIAPLMEELVQPGDLATIRQPLDFYGVNYYSPIRIAAAPDEADLPFEVFEMVGYPRTDRGWTVVPDALREWLITFRARFRAALPPIVITECGAAYGTEPDAHGVVDDQLRIDYLDAHLRAVATACERGVDVRGFYVWSLLDAFEWAEGLSQRYGLVHVDFETLVRTPKRSYQWYAEVIAAQIRSRG